MKINLIFFLSLILFLSCHDARYDQNDSLPKGEPAFTPLSNSWIIDQVGVMSKNGQFDSHIICQRMQDEDLAEVVVLIQNGVKDPVAYSTHYGRWLGLGKKGLSTAGGNNGIVWLIRPDADERMTVSVGRGLPSFTSSDYGKIMLAAKDYINFNNFDKGIEIIVSGTYETLKKTKQQSPKTKVK